MRTQHTEIASTHQHFAALYVLRIPPPSVSDLDLSVHASTWSECPHFTGVFSVGNYHLEIYRKFAVNLNRRRNLPGKIVVACALPQPHNAARMSWTQGPSRIAKRTCEACAKRMRHTAIGLNFQVRGKRVLFAQGHGRGAGFRLQGRDGLSFNICYSSLQASDSASHKLAAELGSGFWLNT